MLPGASCHWADGDFRGTNAGSMGQLAERPFPPSPRSPRQLWEVPQDADRENSAFIAPPPRTHTHPLTKLSEVPPDLAAVRFLASLIQTWSSPPSPVLPGKNPTQQELINLNFHHRKLLERSC